MTNQRGFTLMELMIAVTLLAIVTTLALPSFTQFIQNNRLSGQTNEMITALQLARSEAVMRGVPVAVCSSADGVSCGGNWNQGWVAIADPAGDDAEVIRAWASPGPDFQFAPGNGRIVFGANGFANAAAVIDLDLDYCSIDSARQIQVELTGRVSSLRTECTMD